MKIQSCVGNSFVKFHRIRTSTYIHTYILCDMYIHLLGRKVGHVLFNGLCNALPINIIFVIIYIISYAYIHTYIHSFILNIKSMQDWCGRDGTNSLQSPDQLPQELIVLDFLQLLCEGGSLFMIMF